MDAGQGQGQGRNQPPSVSVTSPASGATYPVGATIPFSATASDSDGTVVRMELYVDSIWYATAYSSSHTIALPNAAAGVYTLTAKAWDDDGASTTSAANTLIVGSSGGANQPPSIFVSSPANYASFPAGYSIPFSAEARDADGSIARVSFFVDYVSQATQTAGPYFGISVSTIPPGVHTLTAMAWDNAGASTMSAPLTVTIVSSSGSSNQPPFVSLTSPGWGATFSAPASIAMSATASDVDGTITQVDFFANGTWIHTDTSSPYSFSWSNVIAGGYSLTAVARDNAGTTTVSSTVDISVRPASLPNTAVFTPSINHATAVDRYVLEVFPLGADPTVANPVATRDLGKPAISNGECRADISSTILALTPGTYIATVTAMGPGGSAQSAPSPQFTR